MWTDGIAAYREREFFIDNLLVRIHFIIVMIRWTGLAPWEFEFPFQPVHVHAQDPGFRQGAELRHPEPIPHDRNDQGRAGLPFTLNPQPCFRLIDSCITQLKAQGPSRTCNESKEEEEDRNDQGRAGLPHTPNAKP